MSSGSGDNPKVFVGNLADGIKPIDLEDLFKKYGTVLSCNVIKNFGFVSMEDKNDAQDAIADLNGHTLDGCKLTVEFAHGKKRARPYSGPRDGGYRDRYDRSDRYGSYGGGGRSGGGGYGRYDDGYGYDDRRGGYGSRNEPYRDSYRSRYEGRSHYSRDNY